MSNGTYVYLAGPYTHNSKDVRDYRFKELTKKAGELMIDHHVVYSPITYGHSIVQLCPEIPLEYEWWEHQNLTMLKGASKMIILCLKGWRESKGVASEIAFCSAHGISVEFCDDDRV